MNKIRLRRKLSVFILVFLSVILVAFSNGSAAEDKVSVNSFGATGSGKVDETEFIQKAIDFQSTKGGGTVHFPKGVYLVNALKSIVLKDNINLEFAKGAILKALPNNSERYEILEIHDVKNVNILGYPEIIGERKQHLGTSGEWGFGISIKGSNDITVENAKISDCWGDGIYVGSTLKQNYNKNIKIMDSILNNNRRQGISIISAIDLHISNAVITNTNGTLPQSGIDIEPNNSLEMLKNIKISNLSTDKNKGYGLVITLHHLTESSEPVGIYVDKTENIKDKIAVVNIRGLKGTIKIGGHDYLANKKIISKPVVNVVTNNTTRVTGKAPAGSIITVKIGAKVVGTTRVYSSGKFGVPISKQRAGTKISVFASDRYKNISKATILQVKVAKSKPAITKSHYQTTANLNLRVGPSTNYSAKKIISKGKTIEYLGGSGTWFKVKYGTEIGWVSSSYLKKVSSASTKPSSFINQPAINHKVSQYQTTANLNMRTGASTNYRVITVIPKGKVLVYLGKNGSWYKVKYSNKTGWVSSTYLKKR